MTSTIFKNFISESNKQHSKIKKVIKVMLNCKKLNLSGLTNPAKIFLAASVINSTNRNIVLLTSDLQTSLRYYNELKNFTEKDVFFLPSQEASPYEQIFSDSYVLKQQLNILKIFKNNSDKVIVTNAKTLLNTYLPGDLIEKNSVKLEIKKEIDPQELTKKLVELGYKRTSMVVEPGEFSLRGDILDVFPISANPVRIEFFAEEVEKIKIFDIDSQRSTKHITDIVIEPRYKLVITQEDKLKLSKEIEQIKRELIQTLPAKANDVFSNTVENIISQLESENYFEGIEYLAPLLVDNFEDIFSYVPEDTLFITHESTEFEHRINLQDEKYIKEYEKNINEGLSIPLPHLLHKNSEHIISKLENYSQLKLDSFIQDNEEITESIECTTVPKFLANLDNAANYISDLRSAGNTVFIVSEYPQRIEAALKEWECPFIFIEEDKYIDLNSLLKSKDVIITKQGFSEGFILPEINLAVITDTEIFNKRLKKPTISKTLSKKEDINFLVSVNDLKPNDFVVHAKHGIGKFIGMSKQTIEGQEKDYLTIEYHNSDKLYMPAEQINFLSRYRGAGTPSKLSKMGGADWDSIKSKVKKSVVDIAQDLINLYAQRAKVDGFKFENDSPWQLEMEEAFPYTETPDQLQAIIEAKSDMESTKPMDRLICGDVGFGKTEVAIRAVFKAILSRKQVALLAPTTILAQQHYLNFVERFKPYPVKIEILSRFRSIKEQKETVKRILTGECDLVIGTHRLLQKDIQFKDLGLLVIDEEHRFGVSHKEKLKQMRAAIDVLTLSATPIPRTLYMSLSGVRDMSLINTPPVNRAPVKTYVGEYNKSLIRTAIQHELEREGQVYFVHNRVQSIYKVAKDLEELLPDSRIAVAHGQMNEKELEKIMCAFSNYEFDILVCTTIIESGLDIPNANTIIIDDTDKFGLAQLYQMRGRVGRSDIQAYAYCFYRKDKILTDEAKDRLHAIKDFTTLGSGYQIALRDLEIRGVGNILGAQQHGHMISVGFDLYCSLLDETVQELQGEFIKKKETTIVDINITAYIPDEWVGNKDQKMIEYKRLADVQSLRELELIEEEWEDRFGKIPVEVKRLIQIIKIRLLATEIDILLVRETESHIRIYTDYEFAEWREYKNQLPPKISRLLKWTKAPISSQNGKSVILLNISGLLEQDELNILEELFTNISKIKNK